MQNYVEIVLWIVGAYLVGSLPFGFIVGKMRGVDVRTVGSKNIGATNVYRTVGKGWGLLVFFLDFLKGMVPTLLARQLLGMGDLAVFVGISCVIGHTLTVFMKFKGGKGVATAFGMLMVLSAIPTLSAFGVFVLTVWISHYISLGSCLAALSLAVTIWFCGDVLSLKIMMSLLAIFVIWKHRSNIDRLIHGCENKIY